MSTQPSYHSDDLGKLLLRIAVGGLLIYHGIFKITHGVDFIFGILEHKGWPTFLAYGVYAAEIIAPVLIVFGIYTRIAALVVAFDLFMAIYLTAGWNFFQLNEMGVALAKEVELFFMITALVLFFIGGGRFSVTKNKWS